MKRTLHVASLTGLLLAATSAPAAAKGHVLAVDGAKIYVSLGAADGVGTGSVLTLHHVIEATDPTSQKKLHDSFAIGTVVVVKAGDKAKRRPT